MEAEKDLVTTPVCISRGGGVLTKDGSHRPHRDLWVYILLNTCARRRRRDEHDEN